LVNIGGSCGRAANSFLDYCVLIFWSLKLNLVQDVDYIIVGLGIAGTLLSHKLMTKGHTIVVLDDDNPNSASKVSSGIINPITGRRLVKSWMYEQLKEVFTHSYKSIEQFYETSILKPTIIHRTTTSIKDDNLWRTVALNETQFCHLDLEEKPWEGRINNYISFGGLAGYRVDVPELIKCVKSHIETTQSLVIESFDYSLIEFQKEHVVYKEFRAKKIIFCEGWKAIHNPFFNYINLDPAKGEVVKIEIENPPIKAILKHKLFIVPQADGLYWVGSTYDWKQRDETPTPEKLTQITDTLKGILKEDFKVRSHYAGIRPTTIDRRPIVELHPKHSNLAIFNGLGTKGASIAPFFANKMVDIL